MAPEVQQLALEKLLTRDLTLLDDGLAQLILPYAPIFSLWDGPSGKGKVAMPK